MNARQKLLVAVTAVVAVAIPVGGHVLEHSSSALAAEVRFLAWADTAPAWVESASRVLATVFDPPLATVMVVGIAALTWAATRSWRNVLAGLAVMLAPIAYVFVVKFVIDRPRPPAAPADVLPTDPSYPSGHTACAVAIAFYVGWLVFHLLTRAGARAAAIACCVALPLLVAASRVVLGVHHLTDVVAALVACPLVAAVTAMAVARWLPNVPGPAPALVN